MAEKPTASAALTVGVDEALTTTEEEAASPVQNPLPTRILTALPDLAIAAVFLITWIAPRTFGDRMVAYLMLVMLLEFIIVHSSGFMGSVMLNDPLSPRTKIKSLFGFGAFYGIFALGFSLGFHAWWPLWTILLMTLNRMMIVLLGSVPDKQERTYIQRGWAVSALCYIVFATITVFLPLARFGITRAEVVAQNLPGSGLWVEQPHRVIAFGFLYFLATGISELYSHTWLKSPPPHRSDGTDTPGVTDEPAA
ncbi:MAG TPA: hypothetical protein VKP65_04725 [Rhodothermales bacterium]|nr:hypothetical protein [Rhodothermales bacterium]